MKVIVTSVFRDKFTHGYITVEIPLTSRMKPVYRTWRVANSLNESKFPKKRKRLKISLFEKEFEKKVLVDVLKGIGVQVTGNMGEKTLLDKVAELDEEANAKLKIALGIE